MQSTTPSIGYILSVSSISQHLFSVSLTIPPLEDRELTLSLPSWIPGSYMVRDFARNIVAINAHTDKGYSLELTPIDKQSWKVNTQGNAVIVEYSVYANDLSVRSAFINDQYAFCNGTSVFLSVNNYEALRCTLDISNANVPKNWQIETSMPVLNKPNVFQCENYAELIDHPVFIGECTGADFLVDGVNFRIIFSGSINYNLPGICADLEKVCRHHLELFDQPAPIKDYLFMTLIANSGYGGLEHRNSTALLYPRYELPLYGEKIKLDEGYVNFISLCSHELFHTWHVKRIKPRIMVNPDLSKEAYTDQLWIYEGFTSYYDDVTLARTGVIPVEQYLKIVAQNLTRLARNVGRFKQSIAESSFYAWTKFYKQDASALNNIVSYYNKGGIVALGLDILLREKTQNAHNLDDLMRLLWQQYGQTRPQGTPSDVIQQLCEQHFNLDVSDYLNAVVYGTQDVELGPLLKSIGVNLSYQAPNRLNEKGAEEHNDALRYDFGATVKKAADLGLTITTVQEHSAACHAQLLVNDRLIAINSYIATVALLERLLKVAQKSSLALTVVRDGRLIELTLPLRDAESSSCRLSVDNLTSVNLWLGL